MPGIQIFRRTWKIGSDDLVLPVAISLVARLVWFFVFGAIFATHLSSLHTVSHDEDCAARRIHVYFIGYLIIIALSIVVELRIAYISSRGTIFDCDKRVHVNKYLYLRTFIYLSEIAWFGMGVYHTFHRFKSCMHDVHKFLSMGVVIFNLLGIIATLVGVYLVFDPAGDAMYRLQKKKNKKNYGSIDALKARQDVIDKYQSDWKNSFRLLFCCTKTKNSKDNVLLFASKIFADYFGNYDDLVPSDILAGLILLRQKQKYEEYVRVKEELENTNATYHQVTKHKTHRSVRRHQKTPNSIPFDLDNEEEIQIFDSVTHFAKYAFASYGWPMYCLVNPLGCGIFKHISCCGGCCKANENVTGDNCCLCNFAVQKTITKVLHENFVYVSYSDELFSTPFSVVVDHIKEAVVISCRGTLSLNDVLTDMSVEEVAIPGGDSNWTAHNGFLQAAISIKNKLEEKELIEQALNHNIDKGTLDYNIVIVGHSLGAGVATLLAFLLRPKYPNIKCYAYGPSGSAVSYDASNYARDFVYSVVLGKDLVARLNLNTLNELQHNIIQMLRKTKLPKWRILHGCMCNCLLCCTKSSTRSFDEYFDSEEEMQFEPYNQENESKLYMAGKVVHICKTKSIYPRFGSKDATYQAYWSTPADFQNILISNLMLRDHFPDALMRALQKILPDDIVEIENASNDENGSTSINIPPDTPTAVGAESSALLSEKA